MESEVVGGVFTEGDEEFAERLSGFVDVSS